MNIFKLETLLKEYPFLRSTRRSSLDELLGKSVLGNVSVKELDDETLNFVPTYHYWDGSLGVTDNSQVVDIILDDAELKNVVRQKGQSGSNYAHSSVTESEGETILEGIYRGKIEPEKIKFVVVYDDNYSNWESSNNYDYLNVTIYKVTKSQIITSAIKRAKELAEENNS